MDKKQIIKKKLDEIAQRAKEAKANLKRKKVKSGRFDELYKDLENN